MIIFLQLRCTGGTALCKAYIPEVVYCYNKGSNAYGVQVFTNENKLRTKKQKHPLMSWFKPDLYL